MPRKKRALKVAEITRLKPSPLPTLPIKAAAKIIACLCPVCGKTISEKRAIKAGYVTIDHIGYFESIDWDAQKPFGIILEASGRGSLRNWEYISPQEAPELFEAVKGRLLQALREWEAKGWLKREELL